MGATVRSTVFLAAFGTLYSFALCTLRNFRQVDDYLNPWLSGVLGSSSIFLEKENRRTELSLYLVPQGIQIIWNLLEKRNYVKSIRYGDIVMFSLALGIIMHFYKRQPKSIPRYLTIALRTLFV